MARKLRVEYPGAIYHVMNRGDRREAIFRADADRQLFLDTLGEACVKAGWQVHAFCLMGNHFHWVVETPHGNLIAGMKWFLGIDTSRSIGSTGSFASWLEERRREAEPEEWKAVRRGCCNGAAELKERLLEQMAGQAGVHHGGEEVWESAEQKAERIVREELKKLGWEEAELAKGKKTGQERVQVCRPPASPTQIARVSRQILERAKNRPKRSGVIFLSLKNSENC